MKTVHLYIDLPTGYHQDPQFLMASANPGKKLDGMDRYRIAISLPKKYFESEIDGDADIEQVKEV